MSRFQAANVNAMIKKLIILSFLLILSSTSWPQDFSNFTGMESTENDDLGIYLKSNNPTPAQVEKAIDIAKRAQIINLFYEKNSPLVSEKGNAEIAYSMKAYVTPIAHHENGKIYPKIDAIFSKFYSEEPFIPEEWLRQMKIPIKAGYRISKLSIIFTPSDEIKEKAFDVCQEVIKGIFDEIERLKPKYSQLSLFDNNNIHDAKLPRYPVIFYRHGLKSSEGKKPPEKITKDWCEINISISTITGNPSAMWPGFTELYPLLGIKSAWKINSDNEELNEMIKQIIKKYLSELETLESKLNKNHNQ